MKKKIILIIAIILFTPIFVYADCTKEEIQEYKALIKDIDYDIDFKKEKAEEDGPAMYYKVKLSKLPSEFFVEFKNDTNIYSYYELTDYLIIGTGGVFEVNTFNSKCSDDSLHNFTIYLPEINNNINEDNNLDNSTKKEIFKPVILLLIVGIITLIVVILVLLKKQKRRG